MDYLKEKKISPEAELHELMNEFRRNVDYSSDLVSNLLFWATSQLDGMVNNRFRQAALRDHPFPQDTLTLFSHQAGEKNVLLKEAIDSAVWRMQTGI